MIELYKASTFIRAKHDWYIYTAYYVVPVRRGYFIYSTQDYEEYENFVVTEYCILQGNQMVCYISVY